MRAGSVPCVREQNGPRGCWRPLTEATNGGGGGRRDRTGRRAPRQLTFAVLAAGVLSFALLQSLVIPVLPTIQEELGATQADVTWVLTA